MAAAIILALTLCLAFANGANDVSKGIATLVGSGVTDYRRAVLWGTLWTVVGGMLAAVFASELAATFSVRGLLATMPEGPVFLVAVVSGAIGWLAMATLTGLPVSTTHLSSSAVIGVGRHRRDVRWRTVRDMALAWLVTLPVAGFVAAAAYALLRLVHGVS